jgi:hypothetical protein
MHNNDEEIFWAYDLSSLFRCFNLVPYGSISSGSRLNAITRLVLLIYVILLIVKYKHAHLFFVCSIILILIVHLKYSQENFELLSYDNNKMSKYTSQHLNKTQDYNANPEMRITNTLNPHVLSPNTQRETYADIQYYSPKSGVNTKMFIEPLIVPRSLDREVWGYPSTYPSGMNTSTLYEQTESQNFPNGYNQYLPREEMQYINVNQPQNPEQNPMNFNKKLTPINQVMNDYTKPLYTSPKSPQPPTKFAQQENYQNMNATKVLNDNLGKNNVSSIESVMDIKQPVGNYMLPATPTYMYTEDYFKQPDNKLFLQDVQPNMYSYSVEQTPINANIGITYNPQHPPQFRDQVYNDNDDYPVFTRVDPQLVRDDGTPGQISQNPRRGAWSSKYSNIDAPAGSVNFEDIYDSRFTSYGDPYRSYSDVNLGQVQYYYSDVDAYRRPNFIIRSNVDFVDYHDPNGKIKPYYERSASLADTKDIVENRYDADSLMHREDLMSRQMAKRNAEMWQLREAPLRKQNNSNMTFGPAV